MSLRFPGLAPETPRLSIVAALVPLVIVASAQARSAPECADESGSSTTPTPPRCERPACEGSASPTAWPEESATGVMLLAGARLVVRLPATFQYQKVTYGNGGILFVGDRGERIGFQTVYLKDFTTKGELPPNAGEIVRAVLGGATSAAEARFPDQRRLIRHLALYKGAGKVRANHTARREGVTIYWGRAGEHGLAILVNEHAPHGVVQVDTKRVSEAAFAKVLGSVRAHE